MSAVAYFYTLSHKRYDFRGGGGKVIERKIDFDFLYNFEICIILRRIRRDIYQN